MSSLLQDVNQVLGELWGKSKVSPSVIHLSYEAAENLGMDMTDVPPGSIITLTDEGIYVS